MASSGTRFLILAVTLVFVPALVVGQNTELQHSNELETSHAHRTTAANQAEENHRVESLPATGPGSKLEQTIAFFEKNLIDRAFIQEEITSKIDNGQLESVSSKEITLKNLTKLKEGFKYEVHGVYKQTLWKLDDNGKRVGDPINKDRKFEVIYVLNARTSTGELLGYTRDKNDDSGYEMTLKLLDIHEKRMAIKSTISQYTDLYSAKSPTGWMPGKYSIISEYTLNDNGTMSMTETDDGGEVDPATLKPQSNEPPLINIYKRK